MPIDQTQVFIDSEGDRWFERNRARLKKCDPQRDLPLRLMHLYDLRPQRVLEVGSSNGFRLAAIAERYGAQTMGVEPSAEAIRDGRERFPQVGFVRGSADSIGSLHPGEPFDLVIVNFVLHWIDRRRLFKAVAEVDHALVDDGFLIVGDFSPIRPTRVRYHHLPEGRAYTYKQDYAGIFLASGLYRQVCVLTADHAGQETKGRVDDEDRIAAWLLHKRLLDHYAETSFAGS